MASPDKAEALREALSKLLAYKEQEKGRRLAAVTSSTKDGA